MDGQVLESYARTGTLPSADNAVVVGTADEFTMSMAEDDLLMIRTDLGTSYVHIRGNS